MREKIKSDICSFQMMSNRECIRKIILKNCIYARVLTEGYDGVEAYLGESFCEDKFGMCRVPKGTRGIDGYIGDKSIQVKFKWITDENRNSRYVLIPSNPAFDLLIVIYAESGDSEVRLFGIWDRAMVLRARRPYGKVFLRDLENLSQVQM